MIVAALALEFVGAKEWVGVVGNEKLSTFLKRQVNKKKKKQKPFIGFIINRHFVSLRG